MKEKECLLIYDKMKRAYLYEKEDRLEMKFKKENNFK